MQLLEGSSFSFSMQQLVICIALQVLFAEVSHSKKLLNEIKPLGRLVLKQVYRKDRKLRSIIMSICTWPAYFTGSVLEPTVSNKSSLLPSATSISFTFSSCLRRSNLSGAYVDGIIEGTYFWMKANIAA